MSQGWSHEWGSRYFSMEGHEGVIAYCSILDNEWAVAYVSAVGDEWAIEYLPMGGMNGNRNMSGYLCRSDVTIYYPRKSERGGGGSLESAGGSP